MAIAVSDIIEVSLVTVMDGVAAVNIFHYEVLDLGSAGSDAALIDELLLENLRDVFLTTIWNLATVTSVTATCLKGQKIFPVREAAFLRTVGVAGSVVADHLPVNTAIMTRHRSNKDDPNTRGATARNFWIGNPETTTNNGRLDAQGLVNWQNVAAYFTPTISSGTAQFRRVVYASTPQAPDPQSWDVAVSFADPIIRKMRDRTARICPV